MRRIMKSILAVALACSLSLIIQHSIFAQAKQKPQRNVPKTKEIKHKSDQAKSETKAKDSMKIGKIEISGIEKYNTISQNNLFLPLGSVNKVKREEFVLTGTIEGSAFIQTAGSDKSSYVAEGQNFGNDAKLVRVAEESATILHEGTSKELELVSFGFSGQSENMKGGKSRQWQGQYGGNVKKMEAANRPGKGQTSGWGKQGGYDGGGKGRDSSWAAKMSIDELHEVRGKIVEHIEGLRAKGVTDPEEYEGAMQKMGVVDSAISERSNSK